MDYIGMFTVSYNLMGHVMDWNLHVFMSVLWDSE